MSRFTRGGLRITLGAAVLLTATGLSVAPPVHGRSAVAAVDPVIAAAGDIACDPSDANYNSGAGTASFCRQQMTAGLLDSSLSAVLPLGDEQYTDGTLAKFGAVYDPTWGRTKALHRPVPGNHEYLDPGAAGYFDYYGAQAGPRGQGWYSYDIGAWHLIALNGECSYVGGCGAGTPQEAWLRSDLAAHPSQCTLAYWHEPKFTSTDPANTAPFQVFWTDLRQAGADVILNGHQHNYERFAPQTENGVADPDGIREFVVGTGGKSLVGFAGSTSANSEVRNSDTYGVLKLTLHTDSYDWQFVPEAGRTFSDSGSSSCRLPVAPPSPTRSSSAAPTATSSPVATSDPSPTGTSPAPSPTSASPDPSPTTAAPPPADLPTSPGSPAASPTSPASPTTSAPTQSPGTASPAAPAGCDPVVRPSTSEVVTGQPVDLDVSGLVPGRAVSVEGYARPSTTYAQVRAPTQPSADGTLRVTLRPTTNTRVRVQVEDCPQPGASQVLVVHAGLSISVVRTGQRSYSFRGAILPARPNAGRAIALYYLTGSGSARRAVTTVRADGTYAAGLVFAGTGRLTFFFRTGDNTVNAAATSARRAVSIF